MTNTIEAPPGLAAMAKQFGWDLAEWQERGRLSLRIDEHPRVSLLRGQGGQVALEVRLAPLPADAMTRERLLDRLMVRVTAHAATRHARLTLTPDGEHLLLVQSLDGHDSVGFEDAFAAFLDELDYWRAVLKEPV